MLLQFLPHAVNCGRFCFWRRQSVVFCLCMKYFGDRWTALRQIDREDMFGPSLGWVWRSLLKVKRQRLQGQKRHFSALLAACVRFMFGKTSLASSFLSFCPCCTFDPCQNGLTYRQPFFCLVAPMSFFSRIANNNMKFRHRYHNAVAKYSWNYWWFWLHLGNGTRYPRSLPSMKLRWWYLLLLLLGHIPALARCGLSVGQVLFVGGPNMHTTNPRWRTAAILKNVKSR